MTIAHHLTNEIIPIKGLKMLSAIVDKYDFDTTILNLEGHNAYDLIKFYEDMIPQFDKALLSLISKDRSFDIDADMGNGKTMTMKAMEAGRFGLAKKLLDFNPRMDILDENEESIYDYYSYYEGDEKCPELRRKLDVLFDKQSKNSKER